jgi:hypothetical protein
MSKNQNLDTGGQLTQNQNNAMSDDPRDGGRNSNKAPVIDGEGPSGERPDEQNQDRLRELGERGSRQG